MLHASFYSFLCSSLINTKSDMTDKTYASLQIGRLSIWNTVESMSSIVPILTHFSFFSVILKMDDILSDYQSILVTELQFCMYFVCATCK